VIDSGHDRAAPAAALGLGDALMQAGDTAGAEAAYQQAIDSGDPDLVHDATVRLGDLLKERGKAAVETAANQHTPEPPGDA
jgi:predicted negative regulator of RcsB-dependent stress response